MKTNLICECGESFTEDSPTYAYLHLVAGHKMEVVYKMLSEEGISRAIEIQQVEHDERCSCMWRDKHILIMRFAVEYGYIQHEQGVSINQALDKFDKLMEDINK